jgi:hypothetical protein
MIGVISFLVWASTCANGPFNKTLSTQENFHVALEYINEPSEANFYILEALHRAYKFASHLQLPQRLDLLVARNQAFYSLYHSKFYSMEN